MVELTIRWITNAANTWGFWHIGQFGGYNRRQFGELPSETLRHAHSAGSR